MFLAGFVAFGMIGRVMISHLTNQQARLVISQG